MEPITKAASNATLVEEAHALLLCLDDGTVDRLAREAFRQARELEFARE